VVEQLDSVSSAYAELNAYLQSRGFLEQISALTGIADLRPDPMHFGGGTHENRDGQELDPHVDYNYINGGELHRRLNLIMYLNDEWNEHWGGNLELHSDPWSPDHNQITSISPLFNRAVIFETTEHSWHGFPRICLPDDKKHLSRKSIAIYLYTRRRPDQEIAPAHGTFYVQRPLPAWIKAGYTLLESDINELQSLLQRRDDWIRHYQRKELEYSARLNTSPVNRQWWIDRIYRWTPLSPKAKRRVGEWLFRHAGWAFKGSDSYHRWLENNRD